METFESKVRVATGMEGVERQTMPGVVVAAANKSGSFSYLKAFGTRSVSPDDAAPVTTEDTFWIASCTKLVTTIAALQCVEKGLLSLDDPIDKVLPEWSDPDILIGFDDEEGDGRPVYEKATKKITLRHLLTHSAGMSYDYTSSDIMRWREYPKGSSNPDSVRGSFADEYSTPLIYEPGEGWAYSPSIDWAGLAVERVSSLRLGDFMSRHIFQPLSMTSTSFRDQSRAVNLATRNPDGTMSPATGLRPLDPDDLGGGGLYSNPSDFIKVLTSLLRNDGILLSPSTVDTMFAPHLCPDNRHLMKYRQNLISMAASVSRNGRGGVGGGVAGDSDLHAGFIGGLPNETQTSWGLGGLLTLGEDGEGDGDGNRRMRRKGEDHDHCDHLDDDDEMATTTTTKTRRGPNSLSWGGVANLWWFIDPKKRGGCCGIFASNIVPFGDRKCMEMYNEFEMGVLTACSCNVSVTASGQGAGSTSTT